MPKLQPAAIEPDISFDDIRASGKRRLGARKLVAGPMGHHEGSWERSPAGCARAHPGDLLVNPCQVSHR